jgi:hypothetical protein
LTNQTTAGYITFCFRTEGSSKRRITVAGDALKQCQSGHEKTDSLVFLSSALIAQKDPFLAHDWAPHNPQADGHCCETVAAVPAGSVTRNDSESPKSRICAPRAKLVAADARVTPLL